MPGAGKLASGGGGGTPSIGGGGGGAGGGAKPGLVPRGELIGGSGGGWLGLTRMDFFSPPETLWLGG